MTRSGLIVRWGAAWIILALMFAWFLLPDTALSKDSKVKEVMTLRCYQTEMGAVYVAIGFTPSIEEGRYQWAKGVLIEIGDVCLDLNAEGEIK